MTHVAFGGLDGHRSVATLEDALAANVLIAENLDGRPLDADHGAPARLVSPSQYGFMSTKHLSRIEMRTAGRTGGPRSLADVLLEEHPRARVWEEERHGSLPGAGGATDLPAADPADPVPQRSGWSEHGSGVVPADRP